MGWERCPRPEQIDDCPSNKSAKIPHPTTGLPDSRSATSRIRFATGTAGPHSLNKWNLSCCLYLERPAFRNCPYGAVGSVGKEFPVGQNSRGEQVSSLEKAHEQSTFPHRYPR